MSRSETLLLLALYHFSELLSISWAFDDLRITIYQSKPVMFDNIAQEVQSSPSTFLEERNEKKCHENLILSLKSAHAAGWYFYRSNKEWYF